MENQNIKIETSKSLWEVFTVGQKLFICSFFAIIVLATIFAFVKIFSLNWVTLYSDLETKDAVAISRLLKDNGYSVKIGKDNKSILVPVNMQDKLKKYVYENGLTISNSVGKNLSENEAYRINLETQVAKKVQTVLEKIVGKGNVSVQVNADIDFGSTQSTVEQYSPTVSDTTGSKEIRQVVSSPGTVKRITIGVAVNKILTSKEKQELTDLIASSGGVNFNRGDTVAISSLRFLGLEDEKLENALLAKDVKVITIINMILSEIVPLVLLMLLVAVMILLVKLLAKRQNNVQEISNDFENVYLNNYDTPENIAELNSDYSDLNGNIEYATNPDMAQIKKELNDKVLSNTSEVAKLLVSYIKD